MSFKAFAWTALCLWRFALERPCLDRVRGARGESDLPQTSAPDSMLETDRAGHVIRLHLQDGERDGKRSHVNSTHVATPDEHEEDLSSTGTEGEGTPLEDQDLSSTGTAGEGTPPEEEVTQGTSEQEGVTQDEVHVPLELESSISEDTSQVEGEGKAVATPLQVEDEVQVPSPQEQQEVEKEVEDPISAKTSLQVDGPKAEETSKVENLPPPQNDLLSTSAEGSSSASTLMPAVETKPEGENKSEGSLSPKELEDMKSHFESIKKEEDEYKRLNEIRLEKVNQKRAFKRNIAIAVSIGVVLLFGIIVIYCYPGLRESLGISSVDGHARKKKKKDKEGSEESARKRKVNVEELFKSLDVNENGRATHAEIFLLARLMGFPGSVDEFQVEYADLCKTQGRDEESGFDLESFSKLLNDKAGDYYCDDERLTELISSCATTESRAAGSADGEKEKKEEEEEEEDASF